MPYLNLTGKQKKREKRIKCSDIDVSCCFTSRSVAKIDRKKMF